MQRMHSDKPAGRLTCVGFIWQTGKSLKDFKQEKDMICTALGRENPHVFIRDDTGRTRDQALFREQEIQRKLQGGWLSLDAAVPDGGGGMRAGKSWLHSKPINKRRSNF